MPVLVDPNYKMLYTGLIIDIDGFQGPVTILDSQFMGNALKYATCDIATYFDLNSVPLTYTDNYANMGVKSKFQMKSVVTIVNHVHDVYMSGNTFTSNAATKGIVYLDMLPATTRAVALTNNTFTQNAAYLDASAVFVRARAKPSTPISSTVVTTADSLFCTGFLFHSNYFSHNGGCSNIVGAVFKFECMDIDASSSLKNDRYVCSASIAQSNC